MSINQGGVLTPWVRARQFVYDLASATAVYRNRISPDPIFLTAASPSTGGFYAINRCAPEPALVLSWAWCSMTHITCQLARPLKMVW